ncbi:acyl-CoA dehydrogenase family protein [Paenibacillus kobensis]|uniref:acyl-CoA dehydrogenase family protein n=1 Tax=Paenibacillus kobensis TaxID=59841 RepID=UPI000FDA4B27|nr:acyl-CoA dehydrogenase family protein [Paenibacillus kobensis]
MASITNHTIPTLANAANDQEPKLTLHTLTLPKPFGQEHACAVSYTRMIADLAANDLPLSMKMAAHLSSAWALRLMHSGKSAYSLFAQAETMGSLFASMNEMDLTGSAIGETESITATPTAEGFLLSGVRERVLMDQNVLFMPTCGRMIGTDGSVSYIFAIVPSRQHGVKLTLHAGLDSDRHAGIAAIESYRVQLDDVFVPESELVIFTQQDTAELERFSLLRQLSISAIYLGIAQSALTIACDSAKASRVPQWGLPLSRFPGTQFLVADASILLEACDSQLYTFGSLVNELLSGGTSDRRLAADTGRVTMEFIISRTNQILNYAMKIAGISSIRADHPLALLYGTLRSSSFDMQQMDSDGSRERIAKSVLGEL